MTWLLMLIAVISFALAWILPMFGTGTGRLNLIALGLFCWALAVLIPVFPG